MCCIRIERAVNGFTVCVQDPKIVANNQKEGTKWEDASREFVFPDKEKALKFVETNWDKALPEKPQKPSSFDAAFKEAIADEKD